MSAALSCRKEVHSFLQKWLQFSSSRVEQRTKIDRYVLSQFVMAEEAKGKSESERSDVTDSADDLSKNEASTDIVCDVIKGLDANRYATKKTVAQGMLDIALLTSNASQLKYVLQVGPKHEFYTLLVVLISISIVLQVAMGLVLLSLNLLRDCRFHEPRHRASALNINYATTASAFVVTVLNVLVSAFDSSLARYMEFD